MKANKINEIRDLRNGNWYWIDKMVINNFATKVGAVGITVYSFLASLADRSQGCFPSQKYIAESLGYSRATVNRTLKLLESYKLIRIDKRSRYHCVYKLLKVRCKASKTQMSSERNSDVNQMNTNNNKLAKLNNNIDMENKNFLNFNHNTYKSFKPKNRQELLALDLAESLDDLQGLPLYLSYSKKYPESFLRKVLGEVKEVPPGKIKKSKGALFNYLVKKYDKKTHKNTGN